MNFKIFSLSTKLIWKEELYISENQHEYYTKILDQRNEMMKT